MKYTSELTKVELNKPELIGQTIVHPVGPYRERLIAWHGGPNHELITKTERVRRGVGTEYELYIILSSDPNACMLDADPKFYRQRIRRITTYIDSDQLYEKVENDCPIPEHLWHSGAIKLRT
jgi:hypothetical protein